MKEKQEKMTPMYPDARQEYQFVQGLFLYAALGNQELEGRFPRLVPGDLGPFDLDDLMHFIYAENGSPTQQRNLAFKLKQDATKQNPWITLRARFWLEQCGDESAGKTLEQEIPNLFSRHVDLTKGMASVGWTKVELDAIHKSAYDALRGNREAAWKLHKTFIRERAEDLLEGLSTMDQIALLKRAPKGISREEMAVFWLLIAAENGHAEAQFELGSRWQIPDYFRTARALFWLEKASKGGSARAKKNLKLLEQTNQPQYIRDVVEKWKKVAIQP